MAVLSIRANFPQCLKSICFLLMQTVRNSGMRQVKSLGLPRASPKDTLLGGDLHRCGQASWKTSHSQQNLFIYRVIFLSYDDCSSPHPFTPDGAGLPFPFSFKAQIKCGPFREISDSSWTSVSFSQPACT